MKNTKFAICCIAACLTAVGLSSCGGGETNVDFDFTLALQNGSTNLAIGETSKVVVSPNIKNDSVERSYTYSTSDESYATIDVDGTVKGIAAGSVTFTVVEQTSKVRQKLRIEVVNNYDPANGGYNYAAASGAEAVKARTKILGALEKYAMDSHLTGITMFENGGYVKYANRVNLPTTEYITGYGFGLLSEGTLTSPMTGDATYPNYLHTASASDPGSLNNLNATGSQVSDLASYFCSSYWSTKMNQDKDGYDWYPCLAKDITGTNRPIPLDSEFKPITPETKSPLDLYSNWRIYVKTGEDGLKFRTKSSFKDSKGNSFDYRLVTIDDYVFPYQFLLTGKNGLRRGSEMAGDTTYGIYGAQSYFNATKEMTDQAAIDAEWNNRIADGRLGIKKGHDENGYYLDLSLVNEIDDFTAMYSLSSDLVSPLPREFIEKIGEGSIINASKRYGNVNLGATVEGMVNYVIGVGPYYLSEWVTDSLEVFSKNDAWTAIEPNRYKIEGIKIVINKNAQQNPLAIWDEFNAGHLDSAGVPTSKLSEQIGQKGVYETKGDSTFKLNVNSCDEATWNDLFGPNGKINKNSTWDLKPWMSNDDFLKGLFYSINRVEFANKLGVKPSINYFSDAYMSDPQNGISYNSTPEHEAAVDAYQEYDPATGEDLYGFNKAKAVKYFTSAVNTLKMAGKLEDGVSVDDPTVIHVSVCWMYESEETEYGEDIKTYFETAFNDPAVSNGLIKLSVDNSHVAQWEDVYNEKMMKGQFDLGFGAISGNTLNPLNFMEVLKSDNSSGFTLNWGTDTSKLDAKHPIVFDDKQWSYDALWNVADHGGIVEAGKNVKPVKISYMEQPKSLDGSKNIDFLGEGAKITLDLEFVDVVDVDFDVKSVQIAMPGLASVIIKKENLSIVGNKISFTLDAATASQINTDIRHVNKLDKGDEKDDPTPFTWGKYGKYWSFEIYYSLSIKGGTPTQNYIGVAADKDSWTDK